MKTEATLFSMFIETHKKYKNKIAFIYKVEEEQLEVGYEKFFEDVLILSRAFASKGIKKGSKAVFISDNRYEWIVTDMALVSLGAISIPRGSDTPTQELEFILDHSEASYLILESETLYDMHKEMLSRLKLKTIFVIEAEKMHTLFANTYSYQDLLKHREIYDNEIEEFKARQYDIRSDDTFTIIYTSGTTGRPKGVILTHINIMHNLKVIPDLINLTHQDLWVSILPSWHIFERAVEYATIDQGGCMVYSNIKTFAKDLEEYRPTLVATVPRLWESMYTKINNKLQKEDPKKAKIFNILVSISVRYNYLQRLYKDELPRFEQESFILAQSRKVMTILRLALLYPFNLFAKKKLKAVQEKFGGRLRLAISGGGALPEHIDEWIDAIGIRIVNAYGMTECAPSIAGRALNCSTFGTLGLAVEGTTLKIIDVNGEKTNIGEIGEILVKGDQVTPGYFKNEDENQKSFTKDGYFKTGDLGKLTIREELIITGRSKEVIVLANGENVDPSRIESTIGKLPFIIDAMLVGHNKKGLGALIVPDLDYLKSYAQEHFQKAIHSIEHIREDKNIVNKIKQDMNELLNYKKGFKRFEKLQNIHFLDEEFKLGEELTNTFKKKRYVIERRYREVIDGLLK
ncbi:MAG: long-chain fatty acid--CoA ligase [Sulfurovum sp.]|nr:long-chain fatty acid--CoA ligase [Sulfurovum sp.]